MSTSVKCVVSRSTVTMIIATTTCGDAGRGSGLFFPSSPAYDLIHQTLSITLSTIGIGFLISEGKEKKKKRGNGCPSTHVQFVSSDARHAIAAAYHLCRPSYIRPSAGRRWYVAPATSATLLQFGRSTDSHKGRYTYSRGPSWISCDSNDSESGPSQCGPR